MVEQHPSDGLEQLTLERQVLAQIQAYKSACGALMTAGRGTQPLRALPAARAATPSPRGISFKV
ncbi:hypothetical protein CLM74_18740 [Stenotrophomonas sp. MYb57]|nr:hypothetical protein CLM74_18740 [Stenotrophomonas sp. MYb57]